MLPPGSLDHFKEVYRDGWLFRTFGLDKSDLRYFSMFTFIVALYVIATAAFSMVVFPNVYVQAALIAAIFANASYNAYTLSVKLHKKRTQKEL